MKKFVSIILVMCSISFLFQLAGCIVPKKGPGKAYNNVVTNHWKFDAVIVPGIPFKNGNWDSVMKARVLWSWILYKNGIAKNVIYSGGAVYSPYKEAVIMGLYAQKLGIPKEHIFYETQARHSTENIYYSYLLAKQQHFKTLALATDPFQSSLLKSFTRKRFASEIYHLPFLKDSIAAYNSNNPRIDPHAASVDHFTSITEKEGFFKRLKGTMGKDINWRQYPNGIVPSL